MFTLFVLGTIAAGGLLLVLAPSSYDSSGSSEQRQPTKEELIAAKNKLIKANEFLERMAKEFGHVNGEVTNADKYLKSAIVSFSKAYQGEVEGEADKKRKEMAELSEEISKMDKDLFDKVSKIHEAIKANKNTISEIDAAIAKLPSPTPQPTPAATPSSTPTSTPRRRRPVEGLDKSDDFRRMK